MITAGVDIGSVATKLTLLEDERVLTRILRPTGSRPKLTAQGVLDQALSEAGVAPGAVARVVATGYGRHAIDFGDHAVTEISACVRGSRFAVTPEGPVRTLIDLGGQDIKVITLDEQGVIRDFAMNDKCAAGTGRFLETLARALEIRLEDLGDLSAGARCALPINATCTVFAESEVISLLAQDERKEDIIAGIHDAIAERIRAMAGKLGWQAPVSFNGGGACNSGLRAALAAKLGTLVYVPEHPQFVNALGAALEARAG